MSRGRGVAAVALLGLLASPLAAQGPRITHGVASGEVTSSSAVVWSRSDRPARMQVRLVREDGGGEALQAVAEAVAAADFTAQARFGGLQPATRYRFRVVFEDAGGSSPVAEGSFSTAPSAADRRPLSFVVGGDLGGQRYCRRLDRGYPIFAAMAALEPDFFVANGDMIYADGTCPAQGYDAGWRNVVGDFPSIAAPEVDWQDRSAVREVFLAHWRYNRADAHFQSFLRRTPMYVQWDDHEVINDFGAGWQHWTAQLERRGFPNVVAAGRESLFLFHPMVRHAEDPDRIYRSFRWGGELELFLLDARSYRSLNDLADRPEQGKSLLGAEQVTWLVAGLASSDAIWKVVSSDVPLSVPTGSNAGLYGRDAFAAGTDEDYSSRTGFERELLALLAHLDAADVENLVFVATDVHFAMNVRYGVDADGDGDLLHFHELITGPMTAGRTPEPKQLDPTLRPEVLYAEGTLFNFGSIRIEPTPSGSRLVAEVRGEEGEVRPGSRLELVAE